ASSGGLVEAGSAARGALAFALGAVIYAVKRPRAGRRGVAKSPRSGFRPPAGPRNTRVLLRPGAPGALAPERFFDASRAHRRYAGCASSSFSASSASAPALALAWLKKPSARRRRRSVTAWRAMVLHSRYQCHIASSRDFSSSSE